MDELYAIVGIGLCIFIFLGVLLGIGTFYGGSWQTISVEVTKFTLLIVGFSFGAYVLVQWLERR